MAFIDSTVVNVALPALQTNLNATAVDVQWVIEAYSLLLSAFLLVGGSLGDHYGRRRIFLIGVALFAIASAACGFAANVRATDRGTRQFKDFGAALARSRQPRHHQQFLFRRGARPRDRNVVGLQRDHGRNRTGDGWLVDRARVVARGVLSSICRSRSPSFSFRSVHVRENSDATTTASIGWVPFLPHSVSARLFTD